MDTREPRILPIRSAHEVDNARRNARDLARSCGLGPQDCERVALAASELATNLLRYAHGGVLRLALSNGPPGPCLTIESRDEGPGIADIALAMQDGFSTGGGLGNGLPAVRRLMDEFQIESSVAGTTVRAAKYRRTDASATSHHWLRNQTTSG